MDWLQFIVAVLTITGPVIMGVGYGIRRYSDAKYREMEARTGAELEQVKSDTAQAIAQSESIKSLTAAIVAQVEDRKDSTAATRDNTAALGSLKVSIDDWDKRQQLFFQNFSNHVTQFSLETGKAMQQLEKLVEKTVGGLSERIEKAIPDMVNQVTPLVDKITSLVDEVKKVHSVDENQNGKLDSLIAEIQRMSEQLVGSIQQLEDKVEQAILNREKPHETLQSGATGDAGDPATIPLPVGDGAGIAEFQPAGG